MRSSSGARAIDLYSGVGGWSLGLRMAQLKPIASYDLCAAANQTNFKNNRHVAHTVDVRTIAHADFPQNVDFVVGSPPCTEFSFSNRGGRGDLDDGLQDIIAFLEIVEFLKPRAWAMENVPRLADILDRELRRGGKLGQFKHLNIRYNVFNMDHYGLPQRRRRCIAGHFDFNLLEAYSNSSGRQTLGQVIGALGQNEVEDPLYGFVTRREDVHDHELENVLDEEEIRINRANKLHHPIYNSMPFPDPLDRSVRTVTATCTRVSRESIVIEEPRSPGRYRRLTVRERATLQGFPITFQFYGSTYGQKLRMIGNAMPPLFAYYVAMAMRGVVPGRISPPSERITLFEAPAQAVHHTPPNTPASRFRADRRFRFAIPSLHMKSGVRFELTNSFELEEPSWEVRFVFGDSKSIHRLDLNKATFSRLRASLEGFSNKRQIDSELDRFSSLVKKVDFLRMQCVWSHTGPGGTRPFMLLDWLDESAKKVVALLEPQKHILEQMVVDAVRRQYRKAFRPKGVDKLRRRAPVVIAGMLLGCITNSEAALHQVRSQRRRKLASA